MVFFAVLVLAAAVQEPAERLERAFLPEIRDGIAAIRSKVGEIGDARKAAEDAAKAARKAEEATGPFREGLAALTRLVWSLVVLVLVVAIVGGVIWLRSGWRAT